jgi:ribonucleotide reductase alpha subunit
MFNSDPTQNLSPCFLLGSSDSIGGIYKLSVIVHKVGGGIGIHINIRSKAKLL